MGKFSEFPYFLLYNYLNPKTAGYGGSFNGYVRGPLTHVVDEIGYWEHLYLEDEDDGSLTEHLFKILEVNGDYFKFEHGGVTSSYATSAFDPGIKAYIRKDSILHKYINDRSPTYDNFVNLNRTYVYFGEVHPTSDGYWNVIFDGMKNYVYNAVPFTNRSDNLQEFIKIYFDQVYHEIYNLQKNLWTLLDPKEIDLNWLNYLADQYGILVDNDSIDFLGEIPVREWVDTIPYFLKRKGTYDSIYIIWKLFLSNTLNKLRIYEMWHDENLDQTTDIPLGNFYEVPYEMNYSVTPSGEGGDTVYYNFIAPSGYPYWDQNGDTFTTTTTASPSGYMLTPHYTVEIDLSYEPIGDSYIINEDVIDHLQTNWNYAKPVSKFVHYREYISPKTNFSENYVNLYDEEDIAYFNTRFVGTAFVTAGIGGGGVAGLHQQTTANTVWDVDHNLSTSNVIVQCYDDTNYMIYPNEIEIYNSDRVKVRFDSAVRGYAYVSSVDTSGSVHTQGTSAYNWYVEHNLSNKENIVQCFDEDDIMIIPNSVDFYDDNNLTISFGDPEAFTYSFAPSAGSDDGYSYGVASFDNTADEVQIGDSGAP